MHTKLVLAMHGAPPTDFPERELAEFFSLRTRLEHAQSPQDPATIARYTELETRLRAWPRTSQNDPFYAGSQAISAQLQEQSGYQVFIGFNEFCAPSLDEALDQAAGSGTEQVIVITPMLTRGGEHAERDIPDAIQRAQARHPQTLLRYLWPFEASTVAQFLNEQIQKSIQSK
jgi:sirohydrochlorin cobaltochelatase